MDHAQELVDYYQKGASGLSAMSTGWPSLDRYYKVVPGELSIVTGMLYNWVLFLDLFRICWLLKTTEDLFRW